MGEVACWAVGCDGDVSCGGHGCGLVGLVERFREVFVGRGCCEEWLFGRM